MRACECRCRTPPHRYLEDANGTIWVETIDVNRTWRVVHWSWDDDDSGLNMMPTIDPEPVWAEIVAAQLKGQVSE